MSVQQVQRKIAQVRAAIPPEKEELWTLPEGRSVAVEAGLPQQVAALYEVTFAPRCGSLNFWTPAEIAASRADVVDDLAEWGFTDPAPGQWAHIAKRGNASVFLNEVTGAVAVTSADEIKAGAAQLRVLTPDLFEFFDRFALGPEYPIIDQDPQRMAVYSGDAEGWLGLLESAGCLERRELRRLRSEWERQRPQPTHRPPEEWVKAKPSDAERECKRRISRLAKVSDQAFEDLGAADTWDFDRMGIGDYKGASMSISPQISKDFWRLYRMHSASAYGALQFFADESMYENSKELADAFAENGIDPDESRAWLAIAQYHVNATLLLHIESGAVAGLEPAPVSRIRQFSEGLFGFMNSFATGARHGELCYDANNPKQARDARNWMELLQACDLM